MKKILSVILSLVLLLPVLAGAEAPVLPYTIDFGPFTMNLAANDYYEIADSLVSNQVYTIIYVDYDENSMMTPTINAVWSSDDLAREINLIGGMEKYAEIILKNTHSTYASMGIQMTNPTVIMTEWDDNIGCIVTSCTMDYTGSGVDMVTAMYQMQALFCNLDGGSYIFTLTSNSMEQIVTMAAYLDTLQFK